MGKCNRGGLKNSRDRFSRVPPVNVTMPAGLLITTEAMVAEKPEKTAATSPMPDMGGMDF